MATKGTSKTKPRPGSSREPAVPEVTGSEQAFERFLPAARALPARDVLPFRADASLAYHNVAAGVAAVVAREAEVRRDLAAAGLRDLKELPELALGVVFAASQVDRHSGSPGTAARLLAQARPLRALMLSVAEGLARAGLLPAAKVARIHAGRGPIDTATDCVDLAALFRQHAAKVRGKSAVTADHVRQAADLGTQLLALLKPKRAPRPKRGPSEAAAAADARDRLWTLLVRGHEDLWRVGAWLFGHGVDAHVPALQSRAAPAKKRGPSTSPPGPAPAPA